MPPIRHDPDSGRIALQHIVLLRLSLILRSSSLQRRQPVLVSLADNSQRVLLLDLSHLVPVCDPAHGAVDVDDHGAQVVERDGGAAAAHVELRCVRGGFWEGEGCFRRIGVGCFGLFLLWLWLLYGRGGV